MFYNWRIKSSKNFPPNHALPELFFKICSGDDGGPFFEWYPDNFLQGKLPPLLELGLGSVLELRGEQLSFGATALEHFSIYKEQMEGHTKCRHIMCIPSNFWIFQDSQHAPGYVYIRVPNMPKFMIWWKEVSAEASYINF